MISVIIPVYAKTEESVNWLEDCLESLQKQTFKQFEAIVVNDNSIVPLNRVKSKFSDPRFRFFENSQNFGPSATRNVAVELAQYEDILPVDHDDMLTTRALEVLWSEFIKDKSKFVYGDLQLLNRREEGDGWTMGRIAALKPYNFEESLKTNGAIPVTALHSKECHYTAGGWKVDLTSGFEDVEKWIAAGRGGFCGVHLSYVTLLYRRHTESRFYNLRHVNREEARMRSIIQEMHAPIYEGRYDMGCCGGSGSSYSPQSNGGPNIMTFSTLDEIPEPERVWFQYVGNRQATFGMKGPRTGKTYSIQGKDSVFFVHKNDASIFHRTGRGQHFNEVASPLIAEEEEKVKIEEVTRYEGTQPKLSILEQLDRVAKESGVSEEIVTVFREEKEETPYAGLGILELAFTDVLEPDWTVERLVNEGTVEALTAYPGIGEKRAETILKKANLLIEKDN